MIPDEATGADADLEPTPPEKTLEDYLRDAKSFTDIPLDIEMPCPDGYNPADWEKKPATQKRFYLWAMANTKRITGG